MTESKTADAAALILRLALGSAFIAHALLKILVFTMAGTEAFFVKLGYPGFFAWIVMLAELLGGLALIVGVQVRLVSLLLVPIMIGALLVHLPNGWLFTAAGGGWEYPAFWTATLLVQFLLGAGRYSLASGGASELIRPRTPVAAE
ncbi:MAG: DoxX family protein [Alphaproteobacteria bacterium]|nr:DoxX family protein [Alphaproteobacteria bacterium]